MFNANVLVRAAQFNNGTIDKNGKEPVILNVIAGKAPNRLVIAGTVAETAGFELGKVYYANCREIDANEYGRQFRWTVVQEISSPVHTVEMSKLLGNPEVFDVTAKAKEETPMKENEPVNAFDESNAL